MITAHGTASFLKPDLLLATVTRNLAAGHGEEFEDHWFLEADLATEHTPVIARQCATYQAFYATGRYQAAHGLFPAVLWVTTTETRAQALKAAVARIGGPNQQTSEQLFRFCTYEQYREVLTSSDLPGP